MSTVTVQNGSVTVWEIAEENSRGIEECKPEFSLRHEARKTTAGIGVCMLSKSTVYLKQKWCVYS
jgi:hypothetical protein